MGILMGLSALLFLPSNNAPCLDEEWTLLSEAAVAVIEAESEVDSLWPGFWPAERPFILVVPHRGVLIVSSETPVLKGAHVDEKVALTRERFGYVVCGEIPDLVASSGAGFDMAFSIGSSKAIAVPLRTNLLESLAFLYHEAFHAYQLEVRSPTLRNEEILYREFTSNDSYRAALRDEVGRLFQLVNESQSDKVNPEGVCQFLESREQRRRGLAPEITIAENEIETEEGTATYVGRSAALTAARQDRGALRGFVLSAFSRIDTEDTGPLAFRTAFYTTGIGIVYLLDAFQYDWFEGLKRNAMLEDLLREALMGLDVSACSS